MQSRSWNETFSSVKLLTRKLPPAPVQLVSNQGETSASARLFVTEPWLANTCRSFGLSNQTGCSACYLLLLIKPNLAKTQLYIASDLKFKLFVSLLEKSEDLFCTQIQKLCLTLPVCALPAWYITSAVYLWRFCCQITLAMRVTMRRHLFKLLHDSQSILRWKEQGLELQE